MHDGEGTPFEGFGKGIGLLRYYLVERAEIA